MADKKVLVVDDSATMRDMVAFTLGDEGWEVTKAEDGLVAVEILKDQTFDLIITDLYMPNLDGIGLAKHVRQNGFKTPILCLTGDNSDDFKDDIRAAGATGWLRKPFDPDKLIKVAKKVCP